MPTRTARKSTTRSRKVVGARRLARDEHVYLNIPGVRDRVPLQLPTNKKETQRFALTWLYSLRNRERWAGRPELLDSHRDQIRKVAADYGMSPTVLAQIADAGLVEVSIPYFSEGEGWELRIMPWEYLISTATRDRRGGKTLTVVRHLRTSHKPAPPKRPREWTYVEFAVGTLREKFDFDTERDLVRQAADVAAIKLRPPVIDPTSTDLERVLADVKSGDVVHFAGFDPHQGLQVLEDPSAESAHDGVLCRRTNTVASPDEESSRATEVVTSFSVAKALTSDDRQPRLVACNLYYSAARTAAMVVALGAEAAIGFQDSFDETLAELFYSTFYQAWRLSKWNTAAAFSYAWEAVRAEGQPLHGSGVVLWCARSIRDTHSSWSTLPRQDSRVIDERWRVELDKAGLTLNADNVHDLLEVDIQALPALNYSLLHNDGALFERFTIRKKSIRIGRVQNLHVRINLHVGTDSFPYQKTLELRERQMTTDLHQRIRISLASALTRALRESVRTTLFIEVMWGEETVRRETLPITLLPVDEWVDTDDNRVWLPSFVQPRDPAVGRVIDRAQRYLMAIADDPSMGFSGYQSIDTDSPLTAEPSERCSGVDAQVRAIWSALLYDLPLSYINPPPVFSDYSQRLRTPSDVVDGHRGTCIDLALLLASCLEYIEIYPVIFLLPDHAFPGYWRDESYYEQFVEALTGNVNLDKRRDQMPAGQRYSWYLEPPHFREILAEVHAGRLVPLETVGLCEHCGFEEALERGTGNLTTRRQFQAMLDILSARWDENNRVTPLPILRS